MLVAMCLCTDQGQDVSSYAFVNYPGSRYGELCVCALPRFKM